MPHAAVASVFSCRPPAHDTSSDGSAAGVPSPSSGGGFRRSLTWSLSPRRRAAGRTLSTRASLPGTAAAATPQSPRPGSAPQTVAPPFGRPPRPRAPPPPAAPLVRQASCPDPALAEEAAARLRQVFRQRTALAHAVWPGGGGGRGDTWPSPFRRDGGAAAVPPSSSSPRVGRGAAPVSPRGRPLDDSPSRLHGRHGKALLDDPPPPPSSSSHRQTLLLFGAAACAAAAHWGAVVKLLTFLAPTPLSAALMLAAAALLTASGVFSSVAAASSRFREAAAEGARTGERLCGVIDALGLLPILLARLEAELGAVGTDIRSIRRKADWLPSKPRGAAARE